MVCDVMMSMSALIEATSAIRMRCARTQSAATPVDVTKATETLWTTAVSVAIRTNVVQASVSKQRIVTCPRKRHASTQLALTSASALRDTWTLAAHGRTSASVRHAILVQLNAISKYVEKIMTLSEQK